MLIVRLMANFIWTG